MARLIILPASRPQDEGETLVVGYLRAALPDTYTLVPNIEIIEQGRPPFEYDLIVVAPHAVYVIEVKRWRGGIRGDDDTWVVAGRHLRPNPWLTTNNKARVLKSQIGRRQPSCANVWVEAAVAIADDKGELALQGRCAERTFRYTELPAFLTDAGALGAYAGDCRTIRAYLEKGIVESACGRSAQGLTFGNYHVIETLSRRDEVAEYLARNTMLRGEEKVRLRVFSYDPYLPAEDLTLRHEVICREAEALQKIGAHPNLIALRGFDTAPQDPNLFVEITDWSEAGTLRTLLRATTPLSLERKLELAQGIARGMHAAHQAGVIHRDLRPENVLIDRDGQPRLMNFDRARLALSLAHTISPLKPDPSVSRAYMAPELLHPNQPATAAADLYSLGIILFEMLVGATLYESPEDALQAGAGAGGPVTWGALDVPPQLNGLVRRMTSLKPSDRPASAEAVLTELQTIRERPSGTVIEVLPPTSRPARKEMDPATFQIGDVIDHKYEVQAVLPAGGSGRVYKAYDAVWDQTWALKVFNDTSVSLDWLKQEARTLKASDHPNIVKVNTWGRLPSGRFYLVSEFVEGEDLTAYTAGAKRMPVRQAVECTIQLLAALAAIHPDVDRIDSLRAKMDVGDISEENYEEWNRLQATGWYHRDIKPGNLMLTGDTVKLVDFNIAALATQANKTFTGTPGYMLPDIGMMRWDTSFDLFAVGVVLYELVTGQHPYPNRVPDAEASPTDPRTYVPSLAGPLANLLLRAVSVDSAVRYYSARRFRQDLLALDGVYLEETPIPWTVPQLTLTPEEVGRPNYNPFVTRFLTMFSQARRDNSGTRGLDEVAALTYVETRLDRLLKPTVLDGQHRLVIITGNAGDGKTAFIKKLEAEVEGQGGHVERLTPNSSAFMHKGLRFLTNYDGSQDEGAERANDQVLTEFFTPFADGQPHPADRVHLIAVNEGRLIDFFGGAVGKSQFAGLGSFILHFFEKNGAELPPWLLIVDLNRRSVVADEPDGGLGSIFERQLRSLIRPEFWQPCAGCALRSRCFIKFNIDTLADPISGPTVRERLRTLFEIVHLRRQLHITMRDLRSALSWLMFRDHACDDIAAQLASNQPDKVRPYFYFNAYAGDGKPPAGRVDDRLVILLRQLDVAEVANPTADRDLYFQGVAGIPMLSFEGRSSVHQDVLAVIRSHLRDGWEAIQSGEAVQQRRAYHAALRRIAYFERRDDGWQAMLPYRHLERFQQALSNSSQREALKTDLIQGISMAAGARNQELASRFICLRASQEAKAKIKSFRLFPAEDFRIAVPPVRLAAGPYLEYAPDRLLLYHDPQDAAHRLRSARPAELSVSLDVLELLAQVQAGFVPSPNDISGYYINLVIFKNALAHLPYRHALLTRDDKTFYELSMQDTATVVLRRAEEGVLST
ncbi:MAG: protein kinase [Anaerolineae bacterium]